LTPLFAALAAWLTGLIGAHVPGLRIPPDQIIALEVAGFTGATAAAIHWIHGRAHYVELSDDADRARAELARVRAQLASSPTAGPALADIDALLRAHEGQVEAAIDEHVPKAVGQALAALFASLGAGSPKTATVTLASEPAPAPGPAPDPAPAVVVASGQGYVP
jgi:hypothetical protein